MARHTTRAAHAAAPLSHRGRSRGKCAAHNSTIPAIPVVPALTSPANAATNISLTPTLTWGTVANAATYRVQVSTAAAFTSTALDDSSMTTGTRAITAALANGTTYYWRVNAKNTGGTSAWTTSCSSRWGSSATKEAVR